MPLAMMALTREPELDPTYRSKSFARNFGRDSSRAASTPTSYMPPITPPPASTSARLTGARGPKILWSSGLNTSGTSPPEERRPPREARAEGDQHHEVALLHPPAHHRLVEANGHRGPGSIAVAVDIVVRAGRLNRERFRHGLDDADVGLVENEEADIVGLQAIGVEALLDDLADPLDGVDEHRTTVHTRAGSVVVDLLL